MERFVGASGSRIVWIASTMSNDCIKVPQQLSHLSDQEILDNYRIKDEQIIPRVCNKPIDEMKIAFVGVWKIQCGISTYSEYLFPEIFKHTKEYKIFAEHDPDAQPEDNVVRCWTRNEPLAELGRAINDYDPDIVLIQHEYGIFPNARHWISFVSSIKYAKVYTALHSVYRHKDKTVCEAVVPNIIVHTDLARDALVNEKKVAGKIHIIPHGCLEPKDQEPLWNIYKTDHTFMQFGFGFEYKGWETSLEVCSELKEKYPDVFFTGVFSESKFSKGFHDRYFDRLQSLIDKLDIRENVAFLRGFQSEEVLESLFRLNRCLLLPYVDGGDHQVLAVTGAARVAMRSGIPVVTSKVPFFSDLKGVCPHADSVHGFESCIEDAWRDSKEQVIKQNEFLVKNSWQNVAQMYLKAFTV